VEMKIATKAEFAQLCGVSKARVSQWIAEGKIGSEELDGTGRSAKIKVNAAIEKLKLRLDPAQRLGNGLGTKLSPTAREPFDSEDDVLDRKLKATRLQIAEAQNRKLLEDEKVRKGIYVHASNVKEETGRLVEAVLQLIEQGVVEMATETAALHQLPQRDVVHTARKRLREIRAKIAVNLTSQAADLSRLVEEETSNSESQVDHGKN